MNTLIHRVQLTENMVDLMLGLDDEGTAITLPAGYSKALLLGDNTVLPVVNGTVLFKAHEHSKTPCSVIKLSK